MTAKIYEIGSFVNVNFYFSLFRSWSCSTRWSRGPFAASCLLYFFLAI